LGTDANRVFNGREGRKTPDAPKARMTLVSIPALVQFHFGILGFAMTTYYLAVSV
jgi:hypothetical protein